MRGRSQRMTARLQYFVAQHAASNKSRRPQSAPLIVAARSTPTRRVLQMTAMNEAPGVTNKRYWETLAESWNDCQDTFATDQWGVIKRTLQQHLKTTDQVIDFGCGSGRYFAYVAPRVEHVLGLDISEKLLDLARSLMKQKGLTNVEVRQADLGSLSPQTDKLSADLPACDVAICANVLISPEACTRGVIANLMRSAVRPGGKLVLVVPSVASALNIRDQHKRWVKERRRRGYERDASIEAPEDSNDADERRGVFQREGVRTKHFRLVDVQAMLAQHGFSRVVQVERVEYSWNTEFEKPTRFLDRDASVKRPFDWLVVAVRDDDVLHQHHPRAPCAHTLQSAAGRATLTHKIAPSPPSHRSAPENAPVPRGGIVKSTATKIAVHAAVRQRPAESPVLRAALKMPHPGVQAPAPQRAPAPAFSPSSAPKIPIAAASEKLEYNITNARRTGADASTTPPLRSPSLTSLYEIPWKGASKAGPGRAHASTSPLLDHVASAAAAPPRPTSIIALFD